MRLSNYVLYIAKVWASSALVFDGQNIKNICIRTPTRSFIKDDSAQFLGQLTNGKFL